MRLFYHHVGQNGANEDFPKTIYKSRLISEVEDSISESNPAKYHLISQLNRMFPSNRFNCWGVPERATKVIRNLSVNDAVLLVESARIDGRIPVLGQVKVFLPELFRELSYKLWGDDKFPYIFFFNTEELNLQWVEFRDKLNYSVNFNPRGKFYSVSEDRPAGFTSQEKYIDFLRSNHSLLNKGPIYTSFHDMPEGIKEQFPNYSDDTNQEIDTLFRQLSSFPKLKDESIRSKQSIELTPRSNAFRRIVKEIYNDSCAICRKSLFSPNGQPEVQSAHIYPKSESGSDDIRNGICLCRLHHWALDSGWIAFSDEYTVLVREDLPPETDYNEIRKYSHKKISLPRNKKFHPHKIFLRAHRQLIGM